MKSCPLRPSGVARRSRTRWLSARLTYVQHSMPSRSAGQMKSAPPACRQGNGALCVQGFCFEGRVSFRCDAGGPSFCRTGGFEASLRLKSASAAFSALPPFFLPKRTTTGGFLSKMTSLKIPRVLYQMKSAPSRSALMRSEPVPLAACTTRDRSVRACCDRHVRAQVRRRFLRPAPPSTASRRVPRPTPRRGRSHRCRWK